MTLNNVDTVETDQKDLINLTSSVTCSSVYNGKPKVSAQDWNWPDWIDGVSNQAGELMWVRKWWVLVVSQQNSGQMKV